MDERKLEIKRKAKLKRLNKIAPNVYESMRPRDMHGRKKILPTPAENGVWQLRFQKWWNSNGFNWEPNDREDRDDLRRTKNNIRRRRMDFGPTIS